QREAVSEVPKGRLYGRRLVGRGQARRNRSARIVVVQAVGDLAAVLRLDALRLAVTAPDPVLEVDAVAQRVRTSVDRDVERPRIGTVLRPATTCPADRAVHVSVHRRRPAKIRIETGR